MAEEGLFISEFLKCERDIAMQELWDRLLCRFSPSAASGRDIYKVRNKTENIKFQESGDKA